MRLMLFKLNRDIVTRTRNDLGALRDAALANPGQTLLALLPILLCVPWDPAISTSHRAVGCRLSLFSASCFHWSQKDQCLCVVPASIGRINQQFGL